MYYYMTHIYFFQRVQRIIVVGPAKTFHAKYTFNLDIWIRRVWKTLRRQRQSRFNRTQLLAVVVVVAFICLIIDLLRRCRTYVLFARICFNKPTRK